MIRSTASTGPTARLIPAWGIAPGTAFAESCSPEGVCHPAQRTHGSPRQGSRVLGQYPGRCPGLGWSAPVGAFGGRASHLAGVSFVQWGQRAGWVRRAADHVGLWRGSVGLKRGSVRRELSSARRELDVVGQEPGRGRAGTWLGTAGTELGSAGTGLGSAGLWEALAGGFVSWPEGEPLPLNGDLRCRKSPLTSCPSTRPMESHHPTDRFR